MKKRILCTLLTLCMVFAMLPTAAFAADVVSVVYANVIEPEGGIKPAYYAYTGSSPTANVSTKVTKIQWSGDLDADGRFIGGNSYTVRLTVEIKDGVGRTFSTYLKDNSRNKATINEEPCTVASWSPNTLVLTQTYKALPTLSATGEVMHDVGIAGKNLYITYLRHNVQTSHKATIKEGEYIHFLSYSALDTMPRVIHNGKEAVFRKTDGAVLNWQEVTMPMKDKGAVIVASAPVKNTTTDGLTAFHVHATADGASQTNCMGVYNEGDTIDIIDPNYSSDMVKIKYTDGYLAYFPKKYVDMSGISIDKVEGAKPKIGYVTSAEAAEQSTEQHLTLTINSNEDWKRTGDVYGPNSYSRLVLNNAGGADALRYFETYIGNYDHLEEIWFAPDYDDMPDYLEILAGKFSPTGIYLSNSMNRGDCYILVSDTTPKATLTDLYPACGIKTYSGDLNSAMAKGVTATNWPCTTHNYTARIDRADRAITYKSCVQAEEYYYSCANCGKCEYNPNHTFVLEKPALWHNTEAKLMTDEAYIGVNSNGQHVYWLSCYDCGKTEKQISVDDAYENFKLAGMDPEYTYQMYLADLNKRNAETEKSVLLPNANTYGTFAVNSAPVTAKVDGWAENDVNWAKEHNLIDEALLGKDYTAAMTRLQFCSVAVKMAERISDIAIQPAPTSTFTDTTNEYVLKAYAAGITSGTGDGTFSPDATLTRQQMATFIQRALAYVETVSDIRYTDYTSKLGDYADNGSIASWAKDSLAFMNALGLVKGTTDTTIAPDGLCTIEQALIVANRSLDADRLGWYITRSDKNGYYNPYTYYSWYSYFSYVIGSIPHTYVPGEKHWVTGGRWDLNFPMLEFTDPDTGCTITAHEENFSAIRD